MTQRKAQIFLYTLVVFLTACAENSPQVPTPIPTTKPIPTSTPLPTPTATPDFDILLEPGWEALSSENYEIAESVADEILAMNNQHGNSWMVKGLSNYYREDFRSAIPDFEQAKEFMAENVDLAIEENFIGLFNDVMDMVNNTWDVNLALNYINEIQALFLIIYDLNPESSLIEEYAPVILNSQEDYIYFPDSNEELIKHYFLAEDYFSRGNYYYAIEEFNKAIEVAPDFAYAYLYLGDSYYFIEDYVNSVYYMEKAVEIDPFISDAWAFLGDSYRKMELPQHAKEAYTRALLLNSENHTATLGFGKLISREPWKTDFFNEFGFQLHFLEPEEKQLKREGGIGKINLFYGDWQVYIYWNPTISSFPSKYEENLEYNLNVINNIFMENENAFFEILDEIAYEFLFGVTEFAVQPYQYTPLNSDHFTNAAVVSARCGNHTMFFDFEFGFEIEYGLKYYLSPMLESFRCDLEDHEWFPNE